MGVKNKFIKLRKKAFPVKIIFKFNPMEYSTTQKGNIVLIFEGHEYIKWRTRANEDGSEIVTWRCRFYHKNNANCKATYAR